ncbi:MAG TPA: PAS domain S-box protein, partial [Chitinophagaceae bacterium]|nr:PAS domain S-box protein [Chitinophagaceae bacterium]
MSKQWAVLKEIIRDNGYKPGMFLSLIDHEGNIVSANSAMLKALHLEVPRDKQCNILNLLHPEHIDSFLKAMDDSRGKACATAELYLKNGFYHPVKWKISYIGNKINKEGADFLCTGYKLVEEERLRKFTHLGEAHYQLIMESLAAGVFVQDMQGELIAANQKAAEIFGTTLERLYQLTDIRNLWSTAWKVTNEQGETVCFECTPFMKALASGKLQSEVLVVTLRSGEERCMLFSSQPLFEEGFSVPYSVVSNIVDLTRERKLFREAKENDVLFRSFMSRTPNLAWVIDEDGALLMASKSWYQHFGQTEEGAVSRNILDLVPPSVADALHNKHLQVLETGKSIEVDERVKWIDGSYFFFHINIFPIETGEGKRMVGGH